MNKILLAVVSFITCAVFFVAKGESPYAPHVDSRFQDLEQGALRVLKFPYSFTVTPGVSGQVYNLSSAIPPQALITKSYVYTNTALTSASANTVTVKCASSDLVAATVPVSFTQYAIINGAITAVTSAVHTGANGCLPTIAVGTGTTGITAGKLTVILEYLLPEISRQ